MLRYILFFTLIFVVACSKSDTCTENEAMNKMLALNKVQGRLIAKGGDAGRNVSIVMAKEAAPIGALLGEKKFGEACKLADKIAASYKIDLKAEQEGMITIEDLQRDGGKGGGNCSISDAAKRQMQLHQELEAEVQAGKHSRDIFKQYGEDSKPFAELLSTNPSEACNLLDQLREKYKVGE